MVGYKYAKEVLEKDLSSKIDENHRRAQRRRQPSCGYARISIVGWICRREKLRRRGDFGPESDSKI